MDIAVRFKGLDYSEALVEHTMDRLSKLKKLEIKPITFQVTYSQVRHSCHVELYAQGIKSDFHAKADCESFHSALDKILPKIKRQMAKEKSITKHHKNYERSDLGRLEKQILEMKKAA